MFRVVLVSLVSVLAAVAASAQSEALAALKITQHDAQESIFSSLVTGTVALPGGRVAFKAASDHQRAAMVRAVVGIARTFAATDEFARRYQLYREAQKPVASDVARTGDEARARQREAIELAIRQALDGAAQMPAAARKQLEAEIAALRQQIEELNADPGFRAQVDASAAAAAREEDAALAKQLAVFEQEFPRAVSELVARRLRQFLVACGDVDFAAELERGPDDTRRFVNAAYERRSGEWKMCYRAGKPAVDAARTAAEAWLKTLR